MTKTMRQTEFPTIEAALAESLTHFEDGDNAGYPMWSWLDDPAGLSEYQEETSCWCCGIFEVEVSINGRKATIAINYGH